VGNSTVSVSVGYFAKRGYKSAFDSIEDQLEKPFADSLDHFGFRPSAGTYNPNFVDPYDLSQAGWNRINTELDAQLEATRKRFSESSEPPPGWPPEVFEQLKREWSDRQARGSYNPQEESLRQYGEGGEWNTFIKLTVGTAYEVRSISANMAFG
jgi:hypothetical protein